MNADLGQKLNGSERKRAELGERVAAAEKRIGELETKLDKARNELASARLLREESLDGISSLRESLLKRPEEPKPPPERVAKRLRAEIDRLEEAAKCRAQEIQSATIEREADKAAIGRLPSESKVRKRNCRRPSGKCPI